MVMLPVVSAAKAVIGKLDNIMQSVSTILNTFVNFFFKNILGNRISSTKIYDVVDVPDHHSFKIKFVAYNYFSIVFQ